MSLFQMGPAELREFSRLLQVACDQATAAIPDTPTITLDDTQLTFISDVWTSAMTRDILKVTMRANRINAKALAIPSIAPTMILAALVIEELFGTTLRVQIDRWNLAYDQGLVCNGIPSNLPCDRMLIDRTLAAMLGGDVHRVISGATSLSRNREYQVGDELPSVPVGCQRWPNRFLAADRKGAPRPRLLDTALQGSTDPLRRDLCRPRWPSPGNEHPGGTGPPVEEADRHRNAGSRRPDYHRRPLDRRTRPGLHALGRGSVRLY